MERKKKKIARMEQKRVAELHKKDAVFYNYNQVTQVGKFVEDQDKMIQK